MRSSVRIPGWAITVILLGTVFAMEAPVVAQVQEKAAGEEAGGGRETRKLEDVEPAVNICAGCIAPLFTKGSKGTLTPYGRIELDGIYSTRNTNPLDPQQFNGYGTAAGRQGNSSSTLNPRYSVFGLRADRTDGVSTLAGVVEMDFYGQSDSGNNLLPRLRLAYLKYSPNNNKTIFTVGQDWNPIMGLLSDNIDFSIMGYTGNLWQRIPQITVRQKFSDNFEGLVTVMRFERGLSNCCGNTQVRTTTDTGGNGGGPGSTSAFNDPVQMPYFGTRFAFNGTGKMAGTMLAVNGAYRWYRSAPTPTGVLATPGKDISSYLVGLEAVHQLAKQLRLTWELAYGQALGNEWFRWNQDLNWSTGNPVRALTSWFQLSYAYSRDYTFLFGYGIDNPLDSDLKGSINAYGTTPGSTGYNSSIQYLSNQRTYLTAIHPIWSDFVMGFEWQHFWTNWAQPTTYSAKASNQADMFTLSAWYNF
ncbi:hypothetical protein W02_39100 [Nitrospira sp. KM1]|uniref:hypothetical protein n=1 Tax=Nitrospira sp. KM1 TaxID=1936990 RepID=UPI0013A7AC16|nr:hypothetical protein [Nitrospira sp. KM1]BCA56770.1 hypothetical protein W02_39100 [Nitrospira sp. KM1]